MRIGLFPLLKAALRAFVGAVDKRKRGRVIGLDGLRAVALAKVFLAARREGQLWHMKSEARESG